MSQNREPIGFSWAFRDLLIALMVTFMAMAVLALAAKQTAKAGIKPQGDLILSLYWQKDANADVDLWMTAPGEPQPIGYLARDGRHCDLLRDDLGHGHDPSSRDMEMTVCRNAGAGEYVANAVLYASYDSRFPVHVRLVVTNKAGDTLLIRDGALTYIGQELTLARFQLDGHGEIVTGSVNNLSTPLYETGRAP